MEKIWLAFPALFFILTSTPEPGSSSLGPGVRKRSERWDHPWIVLCTWAVVSACFSIIHHVLSSNIHHQIVVKDMYLEEFRTTSVALYYPFWFDLVVLRMTLVVVSLTFLSRFMSSKDIVDIRYVFNLVTWGNKRLSYDVVVLIVELVNFILLTCCYFVF